jgi:CDP-diacylglycerol---serine O-phosphatidyltransferase
MKYFNIHKLLKLADFVTLLNVVSGVLAIMFAISGNFNLAAIFLIGAVMFDALDGRVARMFFHKTSEKQKDFGKQLDSLADVISFGVAPAIIGYMMGLRSWYWIIVLLLYVCCGVLRLARFNITKSQTLFEGLPITVGGVIIALLIFVANFQTWPLLIMPYVYLIMAILMISSISIKKI